MDVSHLVTSLPIEHWGEQTLLADATRLACSNAEKVHCNCCFQTSRTRLWLDQFCIFGHFLFSSWSETCSGFKLHRPCEFYSHPAFTRHEFACFSEDFACSGHCFCSNLAATKCGFLSNWLKHLNSGRVQHVCNTIPVRSAAVRLTKHKIAFFRLILALLAIVLAADFWQKFFPRTKTSQSLFPYLFTLVPSVCANFYGIQWDQELPAQAHDISAATCTNLATLLSAGHCCSLLTLSCCSLATPASPSSSTRVSLLIWTIHSNERPCLISKRHLERLDTVVTNWLDPPSVLSESW